MTATPAALLAVCLKNKLLRAVCPRRVPASRGTNFEPLGFCYDRGGGDLVLGGHFSRLASSRCVQAGWGLQTLAPFPGDIAGQPAALSGWDGERWIPLPAESSLFSPPLHVHVEIAASLGSPANLGWPAASSPMPHHVTDALLSPGRRQTVSLGRVRWYGRHGQLVLAPAFPSGGEWGDHLIFYFVAGRVRYAVTLHAWMPALRLSQNGITRVTRFQPGPAMPHVIAALKSMFSSTPAATAKTQRTTLHPLTTDRGRARRARSRLDSAGGRSRLGDTPRSGGAGGDPRARRLLGSCSPSRRVQDLGGRTEEPPARVELSRSRTGIPIDSGARRLQPARGQSRPRSTDS